MSSGSSKIRLRSIPSVDEILRDETMGDVRDNYPHQILVDTIRKILKAERKELSKGIKRKSPNAGEIARKASDVLKTMTSTGLRRVINCTGVILHTNLGRAPLHYDKRMHSQMMQGYCNLEYDTGSGKRGSRHMALRSRINALLRAQGSLIVNNNAAALMLCMNTFAQGKEVVVSRGEIVEIGGGFRINEVIAASGARIHEVGTTNRTRLSDYKRALSKDTGAILKVHTSNFSIVGYKQEVDLKDLASLKKGRIPLIYDAGSGLMMNLGSNAPSGEDDLRRVLRTGPDIVTFSGDKLLGGPQCGIIAGKDKLIKNLSANPMFRALRVCKMTVSTLEQTLGLYLQKEGFKRLPVYLMITRTLIDLRRTADLIAKEFDAVDVNSIFHVTIEEGESRIGGGSYPLEGLPTVIVALKSKYSASKVEKLFRMYDTPVIVRTQNNKVLIDVRTILEGELKILRQAFALVIDKLEKVKL